MHKPRAILQAFFAIMQRVVVIFDYSRDLSSTRSRFAFYGTLNAINFCSSAMVVRNESIPIDGAIYRDNVDH